MTAGLRERADMQKFVSQSTVDMIQRGAGRRRRAPAPRQVITLLFCDIRGFTAYAERRPPEEAVAVLNRYLQLPGRPGQALPRRRRQVHRRRGVRALQRPRQGARRDSLCGGDPPRGGRGRAATNQARRALAVGVGIATGDVIVGSIGGANRLDYTAVGAPVNLAARLCAVAEPRETLMNEATFGRCAAWSPPSPCRRCTSRASASRYARSACGQSRRRCDAFRMRGDVPAPAERHGSACRPRAGTAGRTCSGAARRRIPPRRARAPEPSSPRPPPRRPSPARPAPTAPSADSGRAAGRAGTRRRPRPPPPTASAPPRRTRSSADGCCRRPAPRRPRSSVRVFEAPAR